MSEQTLFEKLGVRYRVFGFILGLVPIAHLVMLIKIINVLHILM